MKLRGDQQVALPLPETRGGSIPTSPLQFLLKPCNLATIRGGVERWHSRLPYIRPAARAAYAAWFGGEVWAVLQFQIPSARMEDQKTTVELTRFAIRPGAPKNTASRLLAISSRLLFRKLPAVIRIISYSDTACHTGTIYRAAGWCCVGLAAKPKNWNRGRSILADASGESQKIKWEFRRNGG